MMSIWLNVIQEAQYKTDKEDKLCHYSVVQAYPKALENQRRGDSSADAIKGAGLPKSTFYKWKPIAELLLVDGDRFDQLNDPHIKPSELLASCNAALNNDRLKAIVKEMRSSGELLK